MSSWSFCVSRDRKVWLKQHDEAERLELRRREVEALEKMAEKKE